MVTQETIQTMHCGLHKTPFKNVLELMPELVEPMNDFKNSNLQYAPEDYIFDVKVHMLMPNQYPCIPNWHFDNIPRDENNQQDFSKVTNDWMYLWVSNEPLTEFLQKDNNIVKIEPQKWMPFTQKNSHRGTMSNQHCWRLFIRACPKSILIANPMTKWIRRHSQVYLDASQFTW